MAVNQNQSYTETLREMRTTRMQQLRQGNSQSQLMSRQTAVLSSMNNMLAKQSQMMNRLESSQRASNQQLVSVNRNLTSLSTTLSRSLSNFAATIARGAGSSARAVGGAVAGTTGAVAGTTGAIATSIASGIGKVLPVAIAGYVVKSISWDNMSQETQDKITGSMGNLFDKAMKEIDSTEIGNSLTKALTPAFDQLKSLTKKLGEEIDAVKKKIPSASEVRESIENKVEQAQNKYEEMKPGIEKGLKRAKIGAQARLETTQDIFRSVSGMLPDELPGVPGVSLGDVATGVGTTAATVGGYNLLKPSAAVTKPGGNPKANFGGFKSRKPPSKATTDALKFMTQNPGLRGKEGLLASRVVIKAASGAGAAGKFLEAFKKYKMAASGAFMVLGAALHYWDYKVVKREIELMAEEGIFDQKEVDFLVGRLQAEDWGSFFGGAIVGTLGAVGGSVFGPAGTVLGGVSAGYVGSKTGGSASGALYEQFNRRPSSLDEEISASSFESTSTMVNKGFDTRYGNNTPAAVPTSIPQASTVSGSDFKPLDDSLFEKYRENVGKGEGGSAGYDAMYGRGNEAGVQRYMREETGGKRLTEMTIGEAIQVQNARKKSNTNAMGRYQFMNLESARKMANLSLNDKMSPQNQDKMFDAYTKANASALKKLGVPVSAFTLRLAHSVGPLGAKKLLDAQRTNPNAIPADVLGLSGVRRTTNPHLTGTEKKPVTVQSYLSGMETNVARAMGGPTPVLATNNVTSPAARTTTTSASIEVAQASQIPSASAAAVTPTDGVVKDQTAWGGITAVAEKGKEKVAKMVESLEEKRKRSIAEMFSSTLASLNPESLKSDLLEKLEIAKSVMIGKGESGGTTINNIDNSSTNSQSGGGSTSKSVYPDNVRSNVDHATTMWGGRIT